ncbi:MAG: STAS domain-containing protein [Holosporaceae bacterium]|jgi:SulP family sulfate permease|nr:STAS domain-containing protein [Holosporaceae bacterium]
MNRQFVNRISEWTPEIVLSVYRNYHLGTFLCDVRAGLLVAVVAFPLFMTFAIASGVSPGVGITTAMAAGALASLFGGARFQIVGPTGAFAMIVFDIIKDHGFEGMTMSLMMAGFMMILFGIAGIGNMIHYIPYPITAGFTAGIGLSIIMAQLGGFLGLPLGQIPPNFVDRLCYYLTHLNIMNFYSFGLALFCLIFLGVMQKFKPNMPRYFFVLIIGIIYSAMLSGVGLETIGSRFGNIGTQLPQLRAPDGLLSLKNLRELFPSAFAIAFLGSLESLLGAVISDNLSGQKHRSNMELIGQGIANLGSAIVGGIPATCALGTTSLNVKAGAKTPMAGLFNVLFMLLFILCLRQFINVTPMACLSAMLISTAWNMASFKKCKYILLAPKSDSSVFLATIAITLLFNIVVAVEIGLILSAFLFVKRSVETTTAETFSKVISGHGHNGKECECVRICGHLFFGAAPILHNALKSLPRIHGVIYVDMQEVPFIDVTGAKVLKEFVAEVKGSGIEVIIGGLNRRTMKVLKKMDMSEELTAHLLEERI